jgi:tetratricopeptide (TPR) repeat protein
VDQPVGVLERAQLLINAKRYDDALRTVAALPEDAHARLLAAAAYFHKDDLRRSLREVQHAIVLAPDLSDFHAFRSDVLFALNRKKESVGAAREAVRLDPESAAAHWALGRSAWGVRDWHVAEREAAEALRLAPDWSMAHALAGLVAAGRRRRNQAEAHLHDALALDPNNPLLLNDLAAIQPWFKPQTRAVHLLEEAARLDPSDKQIVENLWATSNAHVRGAGIDRLAIFLGGPTVLMALLALAVLMGWVHLPQAVDTAVIAIAVPLIVAYAVADFVRNRARMRNLGSGTRALYLRRFYGDHWMAVLFFTLTMFIPLVLLGGLAVSIGIPPVLTSGILLALAMIWILLAPLVWRTRLKPWITRRR